MSVHLNLSVLGVLLAFAGACLIYSYPPPRGSAAMAPSQREAMTKQNVRLTRLGIVMVTLGGIMQFDVAFSAR